MMKLGTFKYCGLLEIGEFNDLDIRRTQIGIDQDTSTKGGILSTKTSACKLIYG